MIVTERLAQKILLIQSFEEADKNFKYLSKNTRLLATQEAREINGHNEEMLSKRACLLLDILESQQISVKGLKRTTYFKIYYLLLLWIPLLISGIFVNELGDNRQINILLFPLGGIIFLNIIVYFFMLVKKVFSVPKALKYWMSKLIHISNNTDIKHAQYSNISNSQKSIFSNNLIIGKLLKHLFFNPSSKLLINLKNRFLEFKLSNENDYTKEANKIYLKKWIDITLPIASNKVRFGFHIGAIMVVLGTVLGMYVRGLFIEYNVMWESTFITSNSVENLLKIIFSPAAYCLNYNLPTSSELILLNRNIGLGNANIWIHLWALTAVIYVVLPRSILAVCFLNRIRIERKNVEIDFERREWEHWKYLVSNNEEWKKFLIKNQYEKYGEYLYDISVLKYDKEQMGSNKSDWEDSLKNDAKHLYNKFIGEIFKSSKEIKATNDKLIQNSDVKTDNFLGSLENTAILSSAAILGWVAPWIVIPVALLELGKYVIVKDDKYKLKYDTLYNYTLSIALFPIKIINDHDFEKVLQGIEKDTTFKKEVIEENFSEFRRIVKEARLINDKFDISQFSNMVYSITKKAISKYSSKPKELLVYF